MHKYLRAIGFSSITKRKDYESLIRVCANEADNRAYTSNGDDTMLAVFSKDFAFKSAKSPLQHSKVLTGISKLLNNSTVYDHILSYHS